MEIKTGALHLYCENCLKFLFVKMVFIIYSIPRFIFVRRTPVMRRSVLSRRVSTAPWSSKRYPIPCDPAVRYGFKSHKTVVVAC